MKHTLIAIAAILAAFFNLSAQPVPGSFTQTWQKGPEWLRNAVIYQVYPSSYKDSDGNGIGDIPGVISKLDYIESLGVTAIWFNPLFESGWIDGGYDVIDFYKVDPRFGTNNDLVELVQKAHAKGIKVLLDLVAGHTSDKHPWFLQSGQDSNLQYSDYFIWSDTLPDEKAAKDLEEMMRDTNYMQNTTGKWMKSEYPRAKYYYKNFYACQPALNYGFANPDPKHPWEQGVDAPGPKAMRQELTDILSFWYGKGVDGFRVDMAASLVKNDRDKSEIMRLWREMREWSDANYPEHVLMAEWNDPKYCLAGGFNVDMNLNGTTSRNRKMYFDRKHQADGGCYFSLNGGAPSVRDLYGNPWPEDKIDRTSPAEMLKSYYDYITDAFSSTSEWGYFATITGNHDHLRMNTGARNDPAQLKVMMAWVLTMPLPILYYGDEIGIRSLVDLPNVEGANHNGKERAGGRSPMQWDSSANAGFSSCEPEKIYIPVCPEWTPATSYPLYLKWKAEGCKNPSSSGAITVESQDADPESLLNWTRALIALRKATPALWADEVFAPVYDAATPYPMVYRRGEGASAVTVILNPTGKKQETLLPGVTVVPETLLSSGNAKFKLTKKGLRIILGPASSLLLK